MQEDALLIRRAQKGDAGAFEALMEPYERRIYALCLRMLGNREDAQDCAQDAMLRIWRAMPTYREQSAFLTWACRIATNACLDLLRKRKIRPSVSLDGLVESGYTPADDEGQDPQVRAEKSERKAELSQAIQGLPEDMRSALVLRDVQGFSYEEVSDILDTPLGTVKSRINRARAKLREKLSAREPLGGPSVYTDERRQKA